VAKRDLVAPETRLLLQPEVILVYYISHPAGIITWLEAIGKLQTAAWRGPYIPSGGIDMFKRTRKLIAFIALAVAAGAPLTPARALVPAAWGRFNEINEMIIKTSWEKTKEERLSRNGANTCISYPAVNLCKHTLAWHCKWQDPVGVIKKHPGYCYPAK
jgi:hypothetical protein